MQKASSSVRHYNYTRNSNPAATTFHFTTDLGVSYIAYFIPGERHFGDNPDYHGHIKEFGFDTITPVKKGDPPYPRDIKIKYTILAILKEYIDDNIHSSLIYTCETKDGKQDKRGWLFTRWFDDADAFGYGPSVQVERYVGQGSAMHNGKIVMTQMVLLNLQTCVYKDELAYEFVYG